MRLLSNLYNYFYYDFPRRVKNFFYWGWRLRDDCEWDYNNIFVYLTLKLNNLYRVMNTTRHVKYYPHLLNELKEMRILAKRLALEDFYYDKSYFEDKPRTSDFLGEVIEIGYYNRIQHNECLNRFFYLMDKNVLSLWE